MGCVRLFSKSSYDTNRQSSTSKLPNPNPKNYILMDHLEINNFLLVKIKYPDCTNYEGEKILVFQNTTMKELMDQGSIDPHFSDNPNFKSPIARFVPTDSGWEMAKQFVKLMQCN